MRIFRNEVFEASDGGWTPRKGLRVTAQWTERYAEVYERVSQPGHFATKMATYDSCRERLVWSTSFEESATIAREWVAFGKQPKGDKS